MMEAMAAPARPRTVSQNVWTYICRLEPGDRFSSKDLPGHDPKNPTWCARAYKSVKQAVEYGLIADTGDRVGCSPGGGGRARIYVRRDYVEPGPRQ